MKLNLDFNLTTPTDRLNSIQPLTNQPLTHSNLSTIADYLLWSNHGEIPTDYTFTLPSRWNNPQPHSSIEALLEENPTAENLFHPNPIPYTTPSTPFNRAEALKRYPHLESTLTTLWKEIDTIALVVSDNLDSEKLLKNLQKSYGEEAAIRLDKIKHFREKLDDYDKLKLKRRLVELRKEQYEIAPPDKRRREVSEPGGALNEWFFERRNEFNIGPLNAPQNGLTKLEKPQWVDYLDVWWNEDLEKGNTTKSALNRGTGIDLFDREQFIQVLLNLDELKELSERAQENHDIRSSFPELRRTICFCVWGGLDGFLNKTQTFILSEKLRGKQNETISMNLEEKGGHRYMSNYISTIFRQRIVDNIWKFMTLYVDTKTAVLEKRYEDFKECKSCGRLLLKDKRLFPVSKKSADGFGDTCKFCKNYKKKEKDEIDFDFEGFKEEFLNGFR